MSAIKQSSDEIDTFDAAIRWARFLQKERDEARARVKELESERTAALDEIQNACGVRPESPIAGYRAAIAKLEEEDFQLRLDHRAEWSRLRRSL